MNWQKSSYSTAQGNCVEVASLPSGAAVRDSKDARGPMLNFSADAWQAFIQDVKDGRL
jgi:uncharacterized protein DUF397